MSKITKTAMFATLVATVLVVGIIAASNGITNSILAQGEQKKFTAKLSGKDEVPPVGTAATGMAQFQLGSDGKELTMI